MESLKSGETSNCKVSLSHSGKGKVEEDESIIMDIQSTGIGTEIWQLLLLIAQNTIAALSSSSTARSAKSFSYYVLFVCFYKNPKDTVDTPFFFYHAMEHGHLLFTVTERAKDLSAL